MQSWQMHTQLYWEQDLHHELRPDLPVPTDVPRQRRQGFATLRPAAQPGALLVLPSGTGKDEEPGTEPELRGDEHRGGPGGADAVPSRFYRPGIWSLPDSQYAEGTERTEAGGKRQLWVKDVELRAFKISDW